MPLSFAAGSQRTKTTGASKYVFGAIASVGVAGDHLTAATIGLSRVVAVVAVDAGGSQIPNVPNSTTGANSSNGALFVRNPKNAGVRLLALGAP